MSVSLIVTAAGESIRFKDRAFGVKKQWLRTGDQPLWCFVTQRLAAMYPFDSILVVLPPEELEYARQFTDFTLVAGGKTRSESVQNVISACESDYVLVSDAARACIEEAVLKRVLEAMGQYDCVVPYLGVNDTVFYQEGYLERGAVKLVQTPQLSRREILLQALRQGEFTDESSAILNAGGSVGFVEGSAASLKLTKQSDLKNLTCLQSPNSDTRVGIGIDSHRFCEGGFLMFGGVKIESDRGFLAHSDGDVLIHSVIDALLGAIGGGDIGMLFPDSDKQYEGIDSTVLLQKVVAFARSVGHELINIDTTIVAETPKLAPHKTAIKIKLAKMLGIAQDRVNIKATTAEKMGALGRQEGVMVYTVVNVKFFDWTRI